MYRIIAAGILIASILATVTYQALQIKALRAEATLANSERDAAMQTIDSLQKGLEALGTNALQNQKAQASLRQQVNTTSNLLARREDQIRRLEDENEDFKIWGRNPLPDAVIGLQQHPAITGSQGYQDWLRQRDTVQPATSQPAHQ